ncbi:GtrA family protein [Actinoplanes sp. GCM10030250]|uniref:GtrA family protein n=1 Tax=Actinoplanes sp. GCM10030250 TaxID=3273376 RepID=UPI0036140921
MTTAGTLGRVPNPSQPTGLRTRIRALAREVGKFGLVGGIAFAVDLAIFNYLLQSGSETLTAKTASTVVATTLAFLGNRFWTWRDGDHTNMARQYTMFFVLNAIGLGIALTCLAISHYGLGQIWPALKSPVADNIAGQLVGTAMGTMFRFWSYRRFVFRVTDAPGKNDPVAAGPHRTGSMTSPSSASP